MTLDERDVTPRSHDCHGGPGGGASAVVRVSARWQTDQAPARAEAGWVARLVRRLPWVAAAE